MANLRVWKLIGIRGLLELACFTLAFSLLAMSQWYCDPLERRTSWNISNSVFPVKKTNLCQETVDTTTANGSTQLMIEQELKRVREEMKDYEYPNGKYNISAKRLEDLLIEEGGRPVRSIIASSWRSGSSFLGRIIGAHPANFYFHEPLIDLEDVQIRGPPLAAHALFKVKALLNCQVPRTGIHPKTAYFAEPQFANAAVDDLQKQCDPEELLVGEKAKLLSAQCRVYPFQTMKLTRLRLNVAQELLADEDLAVRILLSVRDPRGIVNSRRRKNFCRDNRDCADPGLICADLIADYKVAVELRKKYPNTFRAIRYEDLAAAPYERAKELADFFGIGFHPKIKHFLDTHTKNKEDSNDPYTLYRDTETAPYSWKTEMKFEAVYEVQRYCTVAMEYWGYVPAINPTHQIEFNPVTSYTLD